MVSMLQVIDNPHQDIPLAAVLLGPMFSLTEDELCCYPHGKSHGRFV